MHTLLERVRFICTFLDVALTVLNCMKASFPMAQTVCIVLSTKGPNSHGPPSDLAGPLPLDGTGQEMERPIHSSCNV